MAVLAALAAALSYALASVLQQWEAEKQPADKALRLSLVARLAKRPRWMAGLGFDVGGYAVQWWALTIGSLVLVQPLLVLGLLFALPIKARFAATAFMVGTGPAPADHCGVGHVPGRQPAGGRPLQRERRCLDHILCRPVCWRVRWWRSATAAARRWKAVAYGTAGGIVYGVCAGLTKSCAHLLSLGVSHLFQAWQPYLLAVAGVAGMVLAQSAFQAGPLDASLPTLSATDPIVSVLIGAVAFGEALRVGVAETDIGGVVVFSRRGRHFHAGPYRGGNARQRHHFEVGKPRGG